MATRPPVRSRPITRDKLAAVFKSPELVREFENLAFDVSETLPNATQQDTEAIEVAQATADSALSAAGLAFSAANAAQAAANAAQADADALELVPYVVMTADPATPQARTLTAGQGIEVADAGPGLSATIGLRETVAILPGNVTDSTGVLVDATGLVVSLEANATYLITGLITFQSALTTTGLALAFTIPAGATISGRYQHNNTAINSQGSYNIASGDVKGDTTTVLVANENIPLDGLWLVRTAGTAGSAQLQFRTEIPASDITLIANLSVLVCKRIA